MSTNRVLFGSLVVLLAGLSCSRENLLTLPAPAPAIAGTYASRASYSPLPIAGDSVTVFLASVAKDTVDVTMQAVTKGKTPVTVQYGKRSVAQDFSTGTCVSYVVWLNPGKDSSLLYMTCSEINVLQYATAKRPYYTGQAARFRKL